MRAGRGTRRTGAAVGLSGVAVLAALGAGAVPAQAAPAPVPAQAAPAPVAQAAAPALDWGPCPEPPMLLDPVPSVPLPVEPVPVEPAPGGPLPDGPSAPEPVFECAEAAVPLDHDEPQGPTVTLALMRRLADDPGSRIGSLFLNPGGPGGSGVAVVPAADFLYPPEVLARFDVVGFDPRGVARSSPLVCFATFDDFFEFYRHLPAFPVTPWEERAVVAAYAGYTRQCAENGGDLLHHMSTADVARDLDLLREAVGDEALTYVGLSYGSQLGTTYANLFPDRVRAVVLDGVLDPVAWTTGVDPRRARALADLARRSTLPVTTRLRSAEGAASSLRQFSALCREAGPERCALADGDPQRRFDRLARRLLLRPVELPLGGGLFQRIGYADLVAATLGALYAPDSWPEFAVAVDELEELRDRRAAGRAWAGLQARLGLDEPGPDVPGPDVPGPDEPDGEPAFQTLEAFDAVLCSDSDNPRTPVAWRLGSIEADLRAPYFGRAWTWSSIACATWPASAVQDRYAGPWNARTANPVLVVGNRHDPATPYSGARTVARLLPASRLLTLEGWGHTSPGLSACVDAAVGAYLVDGVLPPRGATCQPDRRPFAEPGDDGELRAAGVGEDALRAAARQRVLDQVPLP